MIDIDRLSEADLLDLNRRIVARLRLIQDMRAHSQMLNYRVGDRVGFNTNEGGAKFGILTKYNKKTVTILTEDGQHWNVAPGFIYAAPLAERDISPPSQNLKP